MKKLIVLLLVGAFFLALANPIEAVILSSKENADANDDYENAGVSLPVTVSYTDQSHLWEFAKLLGMASAGSNNPQTQLKIYQASLLGRVTDSIAALYYVKPAQTKEFVKYYANKIGVEPAYAQGIGFAGLSPLLEIWKAFRNVAYGFLTVILGVVGFMILFRMKLDPRTVISIQSALPRIIVTLILITFSYAIVGLLIDVMYLLIFVGITTLNAGFPLKDFSQTLANYTGGSAWSLLSAVWSPGQNAIDDISQVVGGSTVTNISALITAGAGLLLGGPFQIFSILGIAGGVALAANHMNPLVAVLVLLGVLFTFVRVFFMLINAYIQIVISLIFGPLQLMFGAIPNTNAFGNWIRGLISNLAVFPLTSVMLLLGQILTTIAYNNKSLWAPPGLAGGVFDLKAGVAGVIGIGIVFMIPNIAGQIKELLKAKPVIPAGTGALFQPVQSVWGTIQQALSLQYYAQTIPWLRGGKK